MSTKKWLRAWHQLKQIGSGIVVFVLIMGGFWGSHYFTPDHVGATHDESAEYEPEVPTDVILSPDKVTAANIGISQIECIDLQRTKTVAATIDYDSTRHLSVKAPVDCVVGRWLIKPGDVVIEGQPLVVLSGAEVALARTEIKKCEADVRIAQITLDWSEETHDNLKELLTILKGKPSVKALAAEFDGKRLGEHRDHLLTRYTEYVLASSVASRSNSLGEQGIIAGRTAEARSSQRDLAATAFKAACEQSEFEGRQELAKSQAELDLARQKLSVARDRLRLLLGPLADESEAKAPGDFEVRAPFGGRVEALHTSPASRLAQGESILTLADTSKLWVSALIHQHDWDALQIGDAETIRVFVPAIPKREFTAKVSFIGPEVSPSTRAVSLVAELDNSEGRFRPGMFAWVDLPMERLRRGLVVPTSAIQRHESAAFAFVAEGHNRFRRVDVATGIETPEYTEITHGLSTGQKVVDHGAFFLKSELLLEQEE